MPLPDWLSPSLSHWLPPSLIGIRAVYTHRTACVHSSSCQQYQLQMDGPQVILCHEVAGTGRSCIKIEEKEEFGI